MMTQQALNMLLEWASLQPKEKQSAFADYYESKKEAYLLDESLGAQPIGPLILKSDMIEVMITRFEEQY